MVFLVVQNSGLPGFDKVARHSEGVLLVTESSGMWAMTGDVSRFKCLGQNLGSIFLYSFSPYRRQEIGRISVTPDYIRRRRVLVAEVGSTDDTTERLGSFSFLESLYTYTRLGY